MFSPLFTPAVSSYKSPENCYSKSSMIHRTNTCLTLIQVLGICFLFFVCFYALSLFQLRYGKAYAELNYHLTPPYQQDTCNLVNISMGESIVGDNQCIEGTPAHVGAYGVTINVDPLDGKQHTFNYIVYRNNCPQGFIKPCTQHLISDSGANQTTPATLSIAMQTPAAGSFCGTYQDDFVITSVDGNSNCHYGDPNSNQFGSSSPGSAGFCATYTNCPGVPPAPGYSISGHVYLDINANQHFDQTEALYARGTNILTFIGSTNFTTTTANGSYTTGPNLPAGTYTVSYTNLPTGYHLSYPRTGPPPSFLVTVGPGCTTNGANDASCDQNGTITNVNFGLSNLSSWIQATCADIRLDDGIVDSLPQSTYGLLTNQNCTSTPGIAFTGDTAADFGQGQASANPADWTVGGTAYPEVYPASENGRGLSYTSLLAKAQTDGLPITDLSTVSGCTNLADCTLPTTLAHGIYQANDDVTLNAFTFPAN